LAALKFWPERRHLGGSQILAGAPPSWRLSNSGRSAAILAALKFWPERRHLGGSQILAGAPASSRL